MSVNDKTYSPAHSITMKAKEDLPAFRFVSHLGSLVAADSKSIGVTETDWLANEYASIITLGTIAIETSTTISAGANVTAETGGKAKPVTGSNPVNGRALDGCTGAGFVRILLVP